ncbi:MAG: DUF1905 domain-containing protein [Calditrichae bacterium]|nr:DUF1905 domain-containing protein [Calditrichota bacterium]MCB9057734.1 DUF1905 domain-containing protein [Calditrichia bacterium]
MTDAIKFTAIIEQAKPGMDAAFIKVPFDVKNAYGKMRVKIIAEFDGVVYRGSIAVMDKETGPVIGVLKDIRQKTGKSFGDTVEVTVREDKEPRSVVVPSDFSEALAANPDVKETFQKYAYTHKKEYVQWITQAKKPETRQKRIAKALEMIAAGKKYS